MSAAVSTRGEAAMRIARHAARFEHPLRQLKPTPRCVAIRTAMKDAAAAVLDHLMDMNNTPEPRMPRVKNLEFLDLMGVISSLCIICGVRIRRSAGEHRMRLISANPGLQRQRPRDTVPSRCCEFVDSRLRRSPSDRASAVSYGQAGENAMRFPHLAHRSAAAHKLHSTTATTRYEFDSGEGETFSRLPALAYSPRKLSKQPEPSQFNSSHPILNPLRRQ